ncbi:MAG: arginine--tRNA ligase [candidate division Zixibacteria bacterium]|nr:arginine--tRNA ligase [candidate division Zixibacteria bacterium]
MAKDKYKEIFAGATADAFRIVFPETYKSEGDSGPFFAETVYDALVVPKDPSMGRFCLPVFPYARLLKQAPPQIALQISEAANRILIENDKSELVKSEPVGGFLNARVSAVAITRSTLTTILRQENNYGDSELDEDQTYLVEYSSPNIAKPFGIGHLRSTILGNSLKRINKKLGYKVVGINFPGDWGTQFGKMIVAYSKWGDENTLKGEAVKNLLKLYVRFHREAHGDDTLNEDARQAFAALENGEPDAVRLWKLFKKVSNAEFDRIYKMLGVHFDWVCGESDLNDKMEPMIERLRRAQLTSHSEGALIVDLEDEQLPPVLLRKSDGATLYATRDLAGLAYRWEKYHGFHKSLYVVNVAQVDHFKQCFKAVAMLEEAERLATDERMTGRVKHVDFGWVKFDGQMMSTRKGNTVLLEEVIDKATDLAGQIIRDKNPDLKNLEDTARMIGVGAVIFSQISVRSQRDIDLRWAEVLNFEGETGPYLQYTHARLCSILRRYGQDIPTVIEFDLLDQPEEQRVIELLADFPEVVGDASEQYEPYFIAAYLLKLAAAFNRVYQRKDKNNRIDKIISDDEKLTGARVALVQAVVIVIKEGLRLLGLQAPEAM